MNIFGNKLLLFVVILFLNTHITGCQKDTVSKQDLYPCDSISRYKVVGEVQMIEGEVIKLPKLFPTTSFFLKVVSPLDNTKGYTRLPLYVCNLPKEYEIEGTHVIFSGKFLWYASDENISIDAYTQPFELDNIKLSQY